MTLEGHQLAHLTGLPLAGLLASGCGRQTVAQWTELAATGGNATLSIEANEHALPDGRKARLVAEGSEVRLQLSLSSTDWLKRQRSFWMTKTPLRLPIMPTDSMSFTLTSPSRAFSPALPGVIKDAIKDDDYELTRFPPNCFRVVPDSVLLRLPAGETPPEGATLSFVLHEGGTGRGRVHGRRFSGRGFQLWPGQTLRIVADIPEDSVLRFATTLEPMLESGLTSEVEQSTTFRVLQGGEQLFEHLVSDLTRPSYAWHEVELVRTGLRTELAFQVHGTLAKACFLDPVLGPRKVGSPGRRPWEERRPDVLVFVADTFRADNMRAYGGQLGLAPNLDRLAEEGLLFRRAWSVGTTTLPAHVSMFTGVMPLQAGVVATRRMLPDDMETIAEMLSSQGYRTGAITDSGVVSRRFGFDQGFEYFDEENSTLEATVERALSFLDADDGRPAFLFVHTYRTHHPYRVSDETRERFGALLGISGDSTGVLRKLHDLVQEHDPDVALDVRRLPPMALRTEAAISTIRQLRAHYLGGVADLDRGFGEFHRALEDRRWFEHGYLVFTSDHGEAFAEHGEITHGETVFEEKIRIPLVIKGKGLSPRVIDDAASLVDLTPTLAELAHLSARPEWAGESLLSLGRDRAVFSFGLHADATLAIIEGSRKVIGFRVDRSIDERRFLGAFDLVRDPGELSDVSASAEPWPRELLQRFRPHIEHLLVPLVDAQPPGLTQEDLDELSKLGYADEFGAGRAITRGR